MSASTELEPSDDSQSKRKTPTVFVIGAIVFSCMALFVGAFLVSEFGRGSSLSGESLVARIDGRKDGHCLVGVRHQHCYGLRLTVFQKDGRSSTQDLDVNIEDRYAHRLDPGALIWVVRADASSEDVEIAIDRLHESPPIPALPK